MERMQAEGDFAQIEPVFFTTSAVGGAGPKIGGKETGKLLDAKSVEALKGMDVIVTCQGGDYTNEVYPQLRAAGWNGYWIDAASRPADEGRRGHHSRSGQPARHQGRAGPRREELRRRQLHGQPDADGAARACSRRASSSG